MGNHPALYRKRFDDAKAAAKRIESIILHAPTNSRIAESLARTITFSAADKAKVSALREDISFVTDPVQQQQFAAIQAQQTQIQARGPYCHSALAFVVPTGILHLKQNGARSNGSRTLVCRRPRS